jgi:hypothetical protein
MGVYKARETVGQCTDCHQTIGSKALLRLVPARCNVGYDLLVDIGQALFQHHRSIPEVRSTLIGRNIHLCASEIGYLGRKFIRLLAIAHRQATPGLRKIFNKNGGYILHLDATHEGDAPALMTGMDGLSRIVMANLKLPSEHSDDIIPFLEQIKTDYGLPLACVHDMGLGINKAVAAVFPGIDDFICHFHFLRDIGKDFMDPAYDRLRRSLRQHKVSTVLSTLVREAKAQLVAKNIDLTLPAKLLKGGLPTEDEDVLPLVSVYSLALWCLHGKRSGNGYGFPFDQPLLTFSERLSTVFALLPEFIHRFEGIRLRGNLPARLQQTVTAVTQDKILIDAVKELQWRTRLFDRLRRAMRIAQPGGNQGLNDDGSRAKIATIRQGVKQFRNRLDENPLTADPLVQKMAEQIDHYDTRLFADPITATAPDGSRILVQPQRTNNILEQFFRQLRRGYRRRTGNNSMSKTLQSMLADTPLVKNLDNKAYVEYLLDGSANLAERFATLDADITEASTKPAGDVDKLLPGFRSLLKSTSLPQQLEKLLAKTEKAAKSNRIL